MAGDLALGRLKVDWARGHMPVLEGIRTRFVSERPFQGLTLSMVLHVEAKTAALALALQAGGATVHLAAGNPLSTDDDAVAALLAEGVDTHAVKGESVSRSTARGYGRCSTPNRTSSWTTGPTSWPSPSRGSRRKSIRAVDRGDHRPGSPD